MRQVFDNPTLTSKGKLDLLGKIKTPLHKLYQPPPHLPTFIALFDQIFFQLNQLYFLLSFSNHDLCIPLGHTGESVIQLLSPPRTGTKGLEEHRLRISAPPLIAYSFGQQW